MGHLQATGIDTAGRKQYRDHDLWRARRDQQRFDSMVDFAVALPGVEQLRDSDIAALASARGVSWRHGA
jgi:DNA topoisomerase I